MNKSFFLNTCCHFLNGYHETDISQPATVLEGLCCFFVGSNQHESFPSKGNGKYVYFQIKDPEQEDPTELVHNSTSRLF